MSRRCELTGKAAQVGHKVSHSNRKTKRRFLPNLLNVTVISDVPGFYRDPERDHWGRLLIDATKPRGREAEFERRRIPGEDQIDLRNYFSGKR